MSISSLIPRSLRRRLRLARENYRIMREGAQDARRHREWASPIEGVFVGGGSLAALETQLTKDYHRVEKGLALGAPRRPFGNQVRRRLDLGLRTVPQGQESPAFVEYAQQALAALDQWNEGGDIDPAVSPLRSVSTGEQVLAGDLADEFFSSRHSVRNFDTNRPVDVDAVVSAVELALNTPSVCNRQASRVTLFTEKEDVLRVLKHQRGNSGFTDSIGAVAVVSVDARLFAGAGERNQRWIDGGLFAMSFVWGLHARGLATCMLNWSMNNAASAALRRTAGLADHEDIICLVAIGYAPAEYRVARSPRRGLDDVLRVR